MAIYDPATYDFNTAALPLLGRVRTAFLARLDERLAPLHLKATDYRVLVILATDGEATASALCAVLSHDPGAMTRKIDGLEDSGLVRRIRSDEDRRAIKLELTAEGRKLYPKAVAIAVNLANEFLHGFTKTEARQLEGMLTRVLENADAAAA
ncbi:MAG: MarR family transcriptional regulator [Usitatibacter sp.]